MSSERLKRLAGLLVGYSLGMKPGERLMIRGSDLSAPLIREVYREALAAGAHPETQVAVEGLDEIFLKNASDQQLNSISPVSQLVMAEYDAIFTIWGDYNEKALSNIDPERQAARYRATRELKEIFMRRVGEGRLKWCGTQYPTHAAAQEAGMSLAEYEEFLFAACQVDAPDPVAAWETTSRTQAGITRFLDQVEELRVVAPDTDLRMNLAGRTWLNCDGRQNMPDGEICTSPVEDSVEGCMRFSFPGIYAGQEIEDIRLQFREGKVVDATAARGETLLHALLDTDPGARVVGELGIGTNPGIDRFTRNMLFDEKISGTVHLAIGSGFPETGGRNVSGIHWDMLCDLREGGEIYADGRLIYRSGAFQLPR